jgi:hypothetical protein
LVNVIDEDEDFFFFCGEPRSRFGLLLSSPLFCEVSILFESLVLSFSRLISFKSPTNDLDEPNANGYRDGTSKMDERRATSKQTVPSAAAATSASSLAADE